MNVIAKYGFIVFVGSILAVGGICVLSAYWPLYSARFNNKCLCDDDAQH